MSNFDASEEIPLRSTRRGRNPRDKSRLGLSKHPFRPVGEYLEDRTLLATFPVTTTANTGAGSLRQAILDANANAGADLVSFNIGTGGAQTISLLSSLPAISDTVRIDGTTQLGYSGAPLIAINGSSAGVSTDGLDLNAGSNGSQILGLVINNFASNGIRIQSNNNIVAACYIGTDLAGTTARPNSVGVSIQSGATANTIGGAAAGAGNLISGNSGDGVQISTANANVVAGNTIGLNLSGTAILANNRGIYLLNGSSNNTIGGTALGARNVISGNTTQGIKLNSGPGNRVEGDYIGTNAAGTAALANDTGIAISSASNLIGTDGDGVNDAAERNVISGNTSYGVIMNGATNNRIAGNYIGTNAAGTALLATGSAVATFFSTGNIIGTDGSNDAFNANERNVISGGVILQNANVLAGNYIGLNAAGTAALTSNPGLGVQVSGTTGSRIGTNADGIADVEERNIISGINGPAILVSQPGAIIAGNYIGTDPNGTFAIPNKWGVQLGSSVTSVRIGTNADGVRDAAEGNLISGNSVTGVEISITSNGNIVAGNSIGLNAAGTGALANGTGVYIQNGSSNNTIGGTIVGARNVISGNLYGVRLDGIGTTGNIILGNYIGTDATGMIGLPNVFVGVDISNGPSNNTIGGTIVGSRNVISGNGTGVALYGIGTTGNMILGNYIGTDVTGMIGIANTFVGVSISNGSSNNTIGGTIGGAINVISGNSDYGVLLDGIGTTGNMILGNYIGTDATGMIGLPNTSGGVLIVSGSSNNTIGGAALGARNVISGNGTGVSLVGIGTTGNMILGNYIGTDATGLAGLGNFDGVEIVGGSSNNTIGGTIGGSRNVISGNSGYGVGLYGIGTTGNMILGNYIGTDATGMIGLPNYDGVDISNGPSNNTIGGTIGGARNVISGNGGDGVLLSGNGTTGNVISGNYIGVGPDGLIGVPNGTGIVITVSATGNTIGGLSASPGTGAGNLISGNSRNGVYVTAAFNTVAGNLIGLGSDGSTVVPNANGIAVLDGGDNSIIGGMNPLARNVISGSSGDGLYLVGPAGLQVLNNYIGTDRTGNLARGNQIFGIYSGGLTNFTLGAAGAGNVISDNDLGAYGYSASNWTIQGNRVGTTADGNGLLPNHSQGLAIGSNPGINFTVGGVNPGEGNQFADSVQFYYIDGGTVRGNLFGLNAAGTAPLIGTSTSLQLNFSSNFVVGGTTAAARNIFVGGGDGVTVAGFGADNNRIIGNYFGLNKAGTAALTGPHIGIEISQTAVGTIIGGTNPGEGNVISSAIDGVYLNGSTFGINAPSGNNAWFSGEGNFNNKGNPASATPTGNVAFGPGVAGGQAFQFSRATPGYVSADSTNYLTLAYNTTVEGWIKPATLPTAGQEYLISANGLPDSPNVMTFLTNIGVSTRIGFRYLSASGSQTLISPPISIATTTFHHVAVTADVFNVNFYLDGALVDTQPFPDTPIVVGTGLSGDPGNTFYFGGGPGQTNRTFDGNIDEIASYNRALTSAEVARIFSIGGIDKGGNWTRNTTILGNIFGLLADGATPGNITGDDIFVLNSESNTIGGTVAGSGNIISGAFGSGIHLSGTYTNANVISGNVIGLRMNGTTGVNVGNRLDGLLIDTGAHSNTIGGITFSARNVVSGNTGDGILLTGSTPATVIEGNFIGTDSTGVLIRPNGSNGVELSGTDGTVMVGGTVTGAGNVIAFNTGAGVRIDTPADSQNQVRQNRIISNIGLGIDVGPLGPTPNDFGDTDGYLNAPVLTQASVRGGFLYVSGFSRPGKGIEFYVAGVDPTGFGQGTVYLGTRVEGSVDDKDSTTGSYSSPLRGLNVGSDSTNRFSFVLPVPSSVTAGAVITAVGVGSVSEFAGNITADAGTVFGAPVVDAGQNATITEGSTFSTQGSFTDLDSTSWTARVSYGDQPTGQPPVYVPLTINPITFTSAGDNYSPTATATFNLSHVYTHMGVFTVTVAVRDDSGITGYDSQTVTVVGAPPKIDNNDIFLTPTTIDQNQSVSLSGRFSDASLGDSHTVQVIWGDGEVTNAAVNEAAQTFSTNHTYLYSGHDNSQSSPFAVQVRITDTSNGVGNSTYGLFYVTVNNVLPSNLVISPQSQSITENTIFTLLGSFDDPGSLDTHQVLVNWGDGSSPSLLSLAPGQTTFNASHGFLNNPSAPTIGYDVQVSVTDNHESFRPVFATTLVTVTDVPASDLLLNSVGAIGTEGAVFNLGGSFTDPGTLDPHVVSVDWGDGTTQTVVTLPMGVTSFSGVTHTYLDNPTGQPHGSYHVIVTVADPTQPGGPALTSTTNVTINNASPTVNALNLTRSDGSPLGLTAFPGAVGQINENDEVTLTGSYADLGQIDRHTVSIAWGDGTTSPATVNSQSRTFSATHRYLDNQITGTPVALTTIQATVTDNDLGAGTTSLGLVVANVAPSVRILSGGSDSAGNITLIALATDPSPIDLPLLTYSWTLTNSQNYTTTATGQSFTIAMTLSLSSYVVTLTVRDKDTGVGTSTSVVTTLTQESDFYEIPNPGPGVSSVIVFGLGGNDTIAAGKLTLDGSGHFILGTDGQPVMTNALTIPVILDGGSGKDTLIGGSGNDSLKLAQGDDTGYGMAGNDHYILIPNSVLTVVDGSGENSLDFSEANFGVTFDLSQSSGQAQNVQPITALHYVSANDLGTGHFNELDGSSYDDTLSAANNSSIYGGAGADQLKISGVSNVFIDGGADSDTLTTSGLGVSNVTFNGDAGGDSLINNAVVTGLTFNGGADNDSFTNNNLVLGTLNFNGDIGADSLVNNGGIAAIAFNGGADNDTFTNNALISGTFVFNGDTGADSLINTGTLATVMFSGGADNDSFTNALGATVANLITFNGDDGSDTFINSGTLAAVVFNGGADNDAFLNSFNSIISSVVFNGDAGSDSLINAGTLDNVTFSGGADNDTFSNLVNASISGLLTFNGDTGADLLQNSGALANITFNGGADNDQFVNTVGSSISGLLTFNGDAGADSLTNTGTLTNVTFNGGSDNDTFINTIGATILGTLVFNGDQGANSLINSGSLLDVTFQGGADNDSFVNTLGASITGTLVFNGDQGANSLVNSGTLANVTFLGGADGDTLTNSTGGLVTGLLTFNGDSGADSLINGGELTNLIFNGGADNDTLVNLASGIVTVTMTFNGDSGANTLINLGLVGALTFIGGADSDQLRNQGVVTGLLTFNGDNGANTLINTSSNLGGILFNGGADVDQFLNQGSNIASITFQGDNGANVLVNDGSAVSSIVFTGGADADSFINTGTNVGIITFNGDAGANYFLNTGVGVSSIVFIGGADNDTLLNRAANVGTITFNGDSGANTLINTGDGVGSILFNGGADVDAFLNTGNTIASITFNGDRGANVLRNDGLGLGNVIVNGGSDSDYLQNNGGILGTLTFNGDTGANVLVNTGIVFDVIFNGGADTDTLYNASTGQLSNVAFGAGAGNDQFLNSGTLNGTIQTLPGGILTGSITFRGDSGADSFINTGSLSGVIFNGGSDNDTLTSTGTASNLVFNGDSGVDSLVLAGPSTNVIFNGGADNDSLVIRSSAGSVSGITFNGDAGADTLVNLDAVAGNLTFNGGADNDTFWNLAANVIGLTFNGDSGNDQFVNTGVGVSGIVFNGDDGADSLINSGNNVGTIVFNGDDTNGAVDNNTLINSGNYVASIRFIGGAGNDSLTNTGNYVGTIVFLGNDGADGVVNSGSGIASIQFDGGSGSDSLTSSGNTIGSIVFTGGAGSDTLENSGTSLSSILFNGGDGSDTLIAAGTGGSNSSWIFNGGNGDDVFILQGSATAISFDGGAGNDLAMMNNSAGGLILLAGGIGNDTYAFIGSPIASVTIAETFTGATDTSVDTLDFSGFTAAPLVLDLALTTPQPLGGGLTLTLTDSNGIENVIGTALSDTIYGNDRPNTLIGAPIADSRLLLQSQGTVSSRLQWVYLDFNTYTDSAEHQYTQVERDAIQARIENDFHGPDTAHPWFNVFFTQRLSDIPVSLAQSGQYATEYFNRTPSFNRPGGESSEVDFGNTNLGGYSSIQINGLVGGGDQPDATSTNFVVLSTKIAAHELAHLMGVRHSDAFGPIGLGVHTPPGSDKSNPGFTGPNAAYETFDHLISSPATVGSDRFNDTRDLYFGPREAIKLAFADHGSISNEQQAVHGTIATAQPLVLSQLIVPNTTLAGRELGMSFQVGAAAIAGNLRLNPATGRNEQDFYAFTGRKGDLINVEVDSQGLARLAGLDTIDAILRVYDASGNLVPYYGGIAVNDDQFEGTDAVLYDLILPADGTYYIQVDSFSRPATDPVFDPTSSASPLNPNNLTSLLNPLNPNFSQKLLNDFLATKTGTDTGGYDLFIYRYSTAVTNPKPDYLNGRAGDDTLIGATGLDTLIGGPGHDLLVNGPSGGTGYVIVVNPNPNQVTTTTITPLRSTVSFSDPSGSSYWDVNVNYGDGATTTLPRLNSLSSFSLNHTFTSAGTYSVIVTIQNDDGVSGGASIAVNVLVGNHSPVLANVPTSVTIPEIAAYVFTATATDPDIPAQSLTYSLINAPIGAAINPSTGLFSWTPTEVQGPGTYSFSVRVTDNGTPALFDQKSINIAVTEVNLAPTIANVPASVLIPALVPYSFTATATDPDIPVNILTFSLLAAPAGATINPTTGKFTWTPTQTQGPRIYLFRVRVTDNGTPVLYNEKSISINVLKANQAPTLANVPPSVTIAENTPYTFTATATDPDIPVNALTFSLVGAPVGASINPSTGKFTWTPTPAQSPGTYPFSVRVTDNGTPNLSDQKPITIVTTQIPPTLGAIANQSVTVGNLLKFTATATDPDLPLRTLSFSLIGGPIGTAIVPASGAFTWTPATNQGPIAGQSPISYLFKVRVTDNFGAYDERSLTVQVSSNSGLPPQLTQRGGGQPLLVAASVSTNDTSSVLNYPALAPLALEAINRWRLAGLNVAGLTLLSQVDVQIADLSGDLLGLQLGQTIWIDTNAAGRGWFIDPTPQSDRSFQSGTKPTGIDLLTVIEHEFGHVLGLGDEHLPVDDVMGASLQPGVRLSPKRLDTSLFNALQTPYPTVSVIYGPIVPGSTTPKMTTPIPPIPTPRSSAGVISRMKLSIYVDDLARERNGKLAFGH